MTTLPLKISQTNRDGKSVFEGTVSICGTRPTKVVRKSDSSTTFGTRSSLITSARNVATRLGYTDVDYAAPLRKAAKKSIKSTKSKTTTATSSVIPTTK